MKLFVVIFYSQFGPATLWIRNEQVINAKRTPTTKTPQHSGHASYALSISIQACQTFFMRLDAPAAAPTPAQITVMQFHLLLAVSNTLHTKQHLSPSPTSCQSLPRVAAHQCQRCSETIIPTDIMPRAAWCCCLSMLTSSQK